MNKTDLIDAIATNASLSKNQAKDALEAFITAITTSLQNNETINIVGFGAFSLSERAERTGRNPKTGKELKIGPTVTPRFKAGKTLKDAVAPKK